MLIHKVWLVEGHEVALQMLHVVVVVVAAAAAAVVVGGGAVELPQRSACFAGLIQLELASAVAAGLGKCPVVIAGHQQWLDTVHRSDST